MAAPAPSLWVVAEDKLVFPSGSIGVTREHLRITGTPLVLAVRPKKLWFARHKGALSEADINRISAVVLDVTLIGEMYRYLLETEFGALLSLKQQHRYGAFTPGLFALRHRRMVDTGYTSRVKIAARKGSVHAQPRPGTATPASTAGRRRLHHREFPTGYSLADCSPAALAAVSLRALAVSRW